MSGHLERDEDSTADDAPARRLWQTPRVIVSELRSTAAKSVYLYEGASGGAYGIIIGPS